MKTTKQIKTIFLIGIHPELLSVVRKSLNGQSYRIVEYISGNKALNDVYLDTPHLIICETETNDIDGKTLFYHITTDPAFKHFQHLPVILFSNSGT